MGNLVGKMLKSNRVAKIFSDQKFVTERSSRLILDILTDNFQSKRPQNQAFAVAAVQLKIIDTKRCKYDDFN